MTTKDGKKIRALLTRFGFVATTATVSLMGPATAIANARLASNHNEVMLAR
jgi:hypothetical protein